MRDYPKLTPNGFPLPGLNPISLPLKWEGISRHLVIISSHMKGSFLSGILVHLVVFSTAL